MIPNLLDKVWIVPAIMAASFLLILFFGKKAGTRATAGIGMVIYAVMQGEAEPWVLGMVVTFSMIIACTVASIAGAMIPLTLKKLGADPATASSIFLTTASDVASEWSDHLKSQSRSSAI